MRKYAYAAFVSALFTAFCGSVYFLLASVDALVHGGDTGKVFADTFLGSIICWGLMTYVIYQIQQAFEEYNEAGRRELEERRKRESQDNQDPPENRQ